jgi:hypothetical protein
MRYFFSTVQKNGSLTAIFIARMVVIPIFQNDSAFLLRNAMVWLEKKYCLKTLKSRFARNRIIRASSLPAKVIVVRAQL